MYPTRHGIGHGTWEPWVDSLEYYAKVIFYYCFSIDDSNLLLNCRIIKVKNIRKPLFPKQTAETLLFMIQEGEIFAKSTLKNCSRFEPFPVNQISSTSIVL